MKKVEERTFVKGGDIEVTFYVNEKDFGDSMGFDSGETIATFTDKKMVRSILFWLPERFRWSTMT